MTLKGNLRRKGEQRRESSDDDKEISNTNKKRQDDLNRPADLQIIYIKRKDFILARTKINITPI